jgi:hypothetical protein
LTSENKNGVYVVKHEKFFEVIENNDGHSKATFDWRLVIEKESKKDIKKEVKEPVKEFEIKIKSKKE